MIAHRGNIFTLYTKDGSKVLGRHRSRKDAQRQEAAIEIAKKKRKDDEEDEE